MKCSPGEQDGHLSWVDDDEYHALQGAHERQGALDDCGMFAGSLVPDPVLFLPGFSALPDLQRRSARAHVQPRGRLRRDARADRLRLALSKRSPVCRWCVTVIARVVRLKSVIHILSDGDSSGISRVGFLGL